MDREYGWHYEPILYQGFQREVVTGREQDRFHQERGTGWHPGLCKISWRGRGTHTDHQAPGNTAGDGLVTRQQTYCIYDACGCGGLLQTRWCPEKAGGCKLDEGPAGGRQGGLQPGQGRFSRTGIPPALCRFCRRRDSTPDHRWGMARGWES